MTSLLNRSGVLLRDLQPFRHIRRILLQSRAMDVRVVPGFRDFGASMLQEAARRVGRPIG